MKEIPDKPFDFWNDHSVQFLEMAFKREYQERVESCDGFGEKARSCGDTIRFYLKVEQDRISALSYDVAGCLFSHACANTLIHLASGKVVAQAKKIKDRDIADFLKTLPEAEFHCAQLAVAAFQAAVEDYESASR